LTLAPRGLGLYSRGPTLDQENRSGRNSLQSANKKQAIEGRTL
jgi:hypothetical protein